MNVSPMHPSEQGVTAKPTRLGTRYEDSFGRVFYLAYAATAVGRGKVARAAAGIDNHNNLSFNSAPAVGATSVDVVLGGTAATKDQYADGWLVVQDGAGEGRIYPIEGHAAQSSTTGVLTVELGEAIDTLGAVSEANVDLVYNKYDELLPPADNGQDYIPVGVPIMVGGLGAAEFGMVQTWGPCAVWRDAAETLGRELTWGAGTGTGQVEEADAVAEHRFASGGPVEGVATEYQMAYLKISR